METTEKIVEAYCRYVQGWFTLPNIKCKGQYEIDLLALNLSAGDHIDRYHIESGVSIAGGFSKLTANVFRHEWLKERVKAAGQRRTVGYFLRQKFSPPQVIEKLDQYGFGEGNYGKIIVSWGWTDEAAILSESSGIALWDFRNLLREVAQHGERRTTYFGDDTVRTLQSVRQG